MFGHYTFRAQIQLFVCVLDKIESIAQFDAHAFASMQRSKYCPANLSSIGQCMQLRFFVDNIESIQFLPIVPIKYAQKSDG